MSLSVCFRLWAHIPTSVCFSQLLLCPTCCGTSLRLGEDVCVCVDADCRDLCLSACRLFEALTPGETFTSSAGRQVVGSDIYPEWINTKWERGGRQVQTTSNSLAHSLLAGKVFTETHLPKMCTFQESVEVNTNRGRRFASRGCVAKRKMIEQKTSGEYSALQESRMRSETRVRVRERQRGGALLKMHLTTRHYRTCRASIAHLCRWEQIHLTQMVFNAKVQHSHMLVCSDQTWHTFLLWSQVKANAQKDANMCLCQLNKYIGAKDARSHLLHVSGWDTQKEKDTLNMFFSKMVFIYMIFKGVFITLKYLNML